MQPEVPTCLRRRYEAIQSLITDMCSDRGLGDPGVQLMCSIWQDIIDEQVLRMEPDSYSVGYQHVTTYEYNAPTATPHFILRPAFSVYTAEETNPDPSQNKTSGQDPEETSGHDPEETSRQDPEEISGQAPEQLLKKVKKQTSWKSPEQTPEKTPELSLDQRSEHTPEQSLDQRSNHTPEQSLDQRSEQTSQQSLGQTPEQTRGQAPDTAPVEAPEQTPVQAPKAALADSSSGASAKRKVSVSIGDSTDQVTCNIPQSHEISCIAFQDDFPLSATLSRFQEAAVVDQNCTTKLKYLLKYQRSLEKQIEELEQKEKLGMELLTEADAAWTKMENTYKAKIAASLERQADLEKQLKEIEQSVAKWQKNKKDLEAQLDNIGDCQQGIVAKINNRKNEMKLVEGEIVNLNEKLKLLKAEVEAAKKGLVNKRKTSEKTLALLTEQIRNLENELRQENSKKCAREKEAKDLLCAARRDLQNVCRMLMQKQLEIEDRKAEKNGVIEERNLLILSQEQCQGRCETTLANIVNELEVVTKEISSWKLRCNKCNIGTNSNDDRKYCSDCPRCLEDRPCGMGDEYCFSDPKDDCICLQVKCKFLENVFENMYIVLMKKIETSGGKALAKEILKCLEISRNGKLNARCRQNLREFILHVIRTNLSLTIIGGAVKTRCEMDEKVYKQLELCLNGVQVIRTSKVDEGTDPKKAPCARWPSSAECNCPKGPAECVCTKKAPPPAGDPNFYPSEPPEDMEELYKCPRHNDIPCGPDCGARLAHKIAAKIADGRPGPCTRPGTCLGGRRVHGESTKYDVSRPSKEPNVTRPSKHVDASRPSKTGSVDTGVETFRRTHSHTGSKESEVLSERMAKQVADKLADHMAEIVTDQIADEMYEFEPSKYSQTEEITKFRSLLSVTESRSQPSITEVDSIESDTDLIKRRLARGKTCSKTCHKYFWLEPIECNRKSTVGKTRCIKYNPVKPDCNNTYVAGRRKSDTNRSSTSVHSNISKKKGTNRKYTCERCTTPISTSSTYKWNKVVSRPTETDCSCHHDNDADCLSDTAWSLQNNIQSKVRQYDSDQTMTCEYQCEKNSYSEHSSLISNSATTSRSVTWHRSINK